MFGKVDRLTKGQLIEAEIEFNNIALETLKKLYSKKEPDEWFYVLRDLAPHDIVTTNYDPVIETELFPGLVNKYVYGSSRSSPIPGVRNLFKIHGDDTDSANLVLAKSQYQRWGDADAYMPAKLRTLFAELPTLCIGYSFRDPNVQTEQSSVFRQFAETSEPVYILVDPSYDGDIDWRELRERQLILKSRNIHMLVGETSAFIEAIRIAGDNYRVSVDFDTEKYAPVLPILQNWVAIALEPVSQERDRNAVLNTDSEELACMLARGLILVGGNSGFRDLLGLGNSDSIPHRIGVFVLEDLASLIAVHQLESEFSNEDWKATIEFAKEFCTRAAGYDGFGEAPSRLYGLFSIAESMPLTQAARLAPAFEFYFRFSGTTLGSCWNCWFGLEANLKRIPSSVLRPLARELVPANDWTTRIIEIEKLVQPSDSRVGAKLRLLSQHPEFWSSIRND